MTYYIVIKYEHGYEIVDESDDKDEARVMKHEYNTIHRDYASVYVKRTVTPGLLKEWNDK